jgi:glycosyltransferase involved in cell wall biosynthesis
MLPEIVIATIMRPVGESGVQAHVQHFVDYLRSQAIRCQLVTPYSSPKAMVYPTFAVRKLLTPLHGPSSVWWYRRWHQEFLERALRQRLADGMPRIIYAQCPLSALAAMRACVNSRQKIYMAVHFNESEASEWADKGSIAYDGPMYRLIQAQEVEALRNVAGIVYVSEFMRRKLEQRQIDINNVPYAIIPNFIADNGEPAAVPPKADLINVGSFEPRKNQGFILDVLAIARDNGQVLTTTLVGDGPTRRQTELRAQRLGVRRQIFFAGYVPHASSQMPGHRAYIHAARVENLPIVLIEAMSLGLPVFAPPVGGVSEVLRDGREGRFLPLDDPKECAARVVDVLTNPSVWFAMGRAARTRFISTFATNSIAPKLVQFLTNSAA